MSSWKAELTWKVKEDAIVVLELIWRSSQDQCQRRGRRYAESSSSKLGMSMNSAPSLLSVGGRFFSDLAYLKFE